MAERFNADEIFEIAEQIERNGAKFYRRAAELVPAEDARALLLRLAAMEDRHVSTFAAMHEELRKEKPDWLAKPFDIDADDQSALYLRAVAEGRIFQLDADPAALLSDGQPLNSILTAAIGLEKDSIVFYLGLKQAVPESLGAAEIDDIIREEMGHVVLLSRQLAELA